MKGTLKFLVAAVLTIVLAASAWATNVTFQVNMTVQVNAGNFIPATDILVARGTFNGWGGNANQLIDNGAGIYVGTWDITPGTIEYKFAIPHTGPDDVWEGVNNRTVVVGTDPLVLPVVYFNDATLIADVEVRFRVDMTVQIARGTFDPAVDWVVVRGSHANIGNWGGAVRLNSETLNPEIYSAWIQFDDLTGALQFKYVYLTAGDPNAAHWEEHIPANREILPTGTEPDANSNGYGEINPATPYFDDLTPADIITNDLTVVFQVEVHPLLGRLRDQGFIYDVQSHDTIYSVESIQVAGGFNTWPWGGFTQEYFMNDGGTNGDVTAGDNIWSVSHLFAAGTERALIYKYGANQLDVEAGFALNHVAHLDDTTAATYYVPPVCWGEQDTIYASWQSECLISSVPEYSATVPAAYRLDQNFPNPFNPSTMIRFSIPRADVMTLRVFNIMGQEVAVWNLGRLETGEHSVRFDASSLASGVYVYRLESPGFSASRKMLLMK
ncbi:T9SS C-terminal target domain-containing protein [candidate division KSB1 bacterium]|nr:MAG: T9SS C-terminal target domain-containing protein [candidate division KSB1 bacterium]